MSIASSVLWKGALAVVLGGAIILSASARAPRKPLARTDLRWLMAGALALYGVGLVAFLKHHPALAVLLAAAGIATSTLAAWLSRGADSGGRPPRQNDPSPPGPDGPTSFDWARFERDLRAYAERDARARERARDPVRPAPTP